MSPRDGRESRQRSSRSAGAGEVQRRSRSHGTSSSRRSSQTRTTDRVSDEGGRTTGSRRPVAGGRPTGRSASGRTRGHETRETTRDASRSGSRLTGQRSTGQRLIRQTEQFKQRAVQTAKKQTSYEVDQRIRKRLSFAVLGIVFALLVLAVWVGLLQTVRRDGYHAASINQRTRTTIIRADRGVIFDRNGSEIALSVPTTTLFADPQLVVDPIGTAAAVTSILQLSVEEHDRIVAALSKREGNFVYLARQINKDRAKAVLDLNLSGVSSYTEPSRVVESGVAGAVIGRTDPDGVGISGLEQQYNELLAGVDGKAVRQRDNKGNSISGTGSMITDPQSGADLVLTIDKSIQFQVDQALLQRVDQLKARAGTVIMMDSRTGDIYAMSNVRRGEDGKAELATGNFAAVEAHEPGSVAKVFSVSAALNEGKVTDSTEFMVPGVLREDGFVIRDAYPHPTMKMTVREILRESSNLGTVITGGTLQPEQMHAYLRAFGFGATTGLEYPGESKGILKSTRKWFGTEKKTVTYGYGYAATPLQLVSGVNVVANGGTYVAPRLVKATIDADGQLKETNPASTRPVLKPEVATTMTSIMKDVVCSGTATLAQVKGMTVAGKTGTGYKAQDNGTYTTATGGRKYFASFVGYFPADDPKITMLVSIDEPDGSSRDRFGGTAAAPVFSRLANVAIQELDITPTGTGTGCPADAKSGH